MENINNEQVETKKKDRRWVVRAIIAFLVILALLTFFSNTIMNATIPKVMAKNAVRGNLSYTNNATGQIEADNKSEAKGIEGRTVDKVLVQNYEYVEEGATVITLKQGEKNEDLETAKATLKELEKAKEYESRTPSDPTDYTSYEESIVMAQETLDTANKTLEAARNKDATIQAAQNTINEKNGLIPGLQGKVDSATSTIEDYDKQIAEIDLQIANDEEQIQTLINLGVPTPTPTPGGDVPAEPAKNDPGESEADSEPAETTDPSDNTDADTTPSETVNPSTERIAELMKEIEDLQKQKEDLEQLKAAAEDRLVAASSELADAQSAVADAQAIIEDAEALPSVTSAQSAVNSANSSLNKARRDLNNARATNSIENDKAKDAYDEREQKIADLKKQIEDAEKEMAVTEIKAPATGYAFNIAVFEGDVMTKDQVVFVVIPEETTYSATFKFPTNVANNLRTGMTLSCDSWFVDTCTVVNIRPDPDNPRETRIVKCSLAGDYMYPGESITVVADRANSDYDRIIASSAINEDNSGTFVYQIKEEKSPLGDKYTVKRVDVTVDATDGALSAISGNNLTNDMIVIRSEKPLKDGERVRLEDYSKDSDSK